MRVAVTGTPGTGKTTATRELETDLRIIHLNREVREREFTTGEDAERGSLVVDLDAVESWLAGEDDILVESHLAHHFPMDRVVVLRCHPEELERRLRDRGESPEKATENAESEALDVVLSEAVEAHGLDRVYEVDATDLRPEEVADEIERVVAGERDPSAGEVDFIDYL